MRLIIAGVVFIIGLFVITSLISSALPADAPEWLNGVAILVGFISSLFLTNKLTNRQGTKFLSLSRATETVEQLEQDGVLTTTTFRAKRAFQVEELEDEGSHFFVELKDRSVLYLNGRYLHEHEPIEFENEIVQRREFPCTQFTIRRRTDDGSVLDVQCSGSVLEPEVVTPPFDERDIKGKTMPKDGDIIIDRTYDDIKADRSAQRRTG